MIGGWQVGDLAVCLADGPLFQEAGLFKGRIYRVEAVIAGTYGGRRSTGLIMAGMRLPKPQYRGAEASFFRKVKPDEHESCEPEFVTLLNLSKQRKQETV